MANGLCLCLRRRSGSGEDRDKRVCRSWNRCALLGNLASKNDENATAIVSAEGIAAVVAGMRTFGSFTLMQQKGCRGLANLAVNGEIQTAIADAGGIEAVLAGMEVHTLIAGVQQTGCRALRKLASDNEANQLVIVRTQGIDAVVAGMGAKL